MLGGRWISRPCATTREWRGNATGEGKELLAVVKANGYGHGMIEVARALREEADLFGVANLHEAQELRESGATQPILLLGPALPEERAAINAQGFIPSVSTVEEAGAFAVNRSGINFVIDTGMGRMGCWQDDALATLEKIVAHSGLDTAQRLDSFAGGG